MAQPTSLEDWRVSLVPNGERGASGRPGGPPAWLVQAYEDPAAFWAIAAPRLVAAAPGASRSAVFDWYDLFHEFGERHAEGARRAFVDYSPGTGYRAETYAVLAQKAKELAAEWRRCGVEPGCTVCVVLAPSPMYVASLLAAWHCGAVVSVVPPSGRSFVQRALQALRGDPDTGEIAEDAVVYCVVGADGQTWVEAQPGVVPLPWRGEGSRASGAVAHRYQAGEAAGRFFSPLTADWDNPVLVGAEQLTLGALRDGLLLLRLSPEEAVSAPGFCTVQFKPGLLLATLAAGAHWLELSDEELGDGAMLFDGTVSVLGISDRVRALLLAGKKLGSRIPKRWFRNIAEDDDIRAWTDAQQKLAQAGIRGMNYFANTAAGGSLFFSPWTLAPVAAGVWRSPGLPCELCEPNGTGMPSLSDAGMLSPVAKFTASRGLARELTVAAVGRSIVALTLDAEVWVMNLGSHWEGKVLPEQQMEQLLLDRFPRLARAAVVVPLPARRVASRARVALVVFAYPKQDERLDPAQVRQYLVAELGENWVPQRVEVYELNPKLLDSKKSTTEIDRASCAAQFLDGTLWSKARYGAVFTGLARLWSEVEPMSPDGGDAQADTEVT